ncbi:MAG: peptide chain release factor N(5)-glutamine methyltransferase [Patescibacteria group bacterium]|nr:peptide chain release factor N(5)-glutamine methyltransferase [Patescibacteria group bacterium]
MALKTVKQYQDYSCQRFKSAGFSEPEKEALALLSAVKKESLEKILTHPEAKISKLVFWKSNYFLKKRLKGWSLAALTHKKGFYGRQFAVNSKVLIPRPETELLVDLALKTARKLNSKTEIIDLGTGSGAIIISLALELKSAANYYASDISRAALTVAKNNGGRFGLKINWKKGKLLTPHQEILKSAKHLIIVANLPYLKPEQLAEPSIKREPLLALVSGKDGLNHYRQLFLQIASSNQLPQSFTLLAEIDPNQTELIKKLAHASLERLSLTFFKDYSGKNRFFKLTNTAHLQDD